MSNREKIDELLAELEEKQDKENINKEVEYFWFLSLLSLYILLRNILNVGGFNYGK